MAEYIEREAARIECAKYRYAGSYDAYAVDCILKAIPAADVAPVVHGQWIPRYEIKEMYYSPDDVERYKVPNGFSCSRCGRAEYRREPYCNCGARMDGE